MVYFVTAERDKGKTSYLEQLVAQQTEEFGGILALAGPNKNSYYAKDVESGQKQLLMEVSSQPTIGKYRCYQEAFDWAKNVINTTKKNKIVIDEVGRLELRDQGLATVLKNLDNNKDYYIAVRKQFVEAVITHFNIDKYEIIEVQSQEEMNI